MKETREIWKKSYYAELKGLVDISGATWWQLHSNFMLNWKSVQFGYAW